jgi:type II secretory pathway pseudopilin PulG
MRQRGFTLIAVMLAMVLLALASQGVMFLVSQQAQREREAQLLRTGQDIARAIGSYYESSPGSVKVFPRELEDLIEDRRFITVKRHLRELYEDPVARRPWETLRVQDGAIEGVYSSAQQSPIRTGPIDLPGLHLNAAARYSDWKFVYVPAAASTSQERK